MKLRDLPTPALYIDADKLENNIARVQRACDGAHAALYPMIKTHKSTRIAALQKAAGAAGFLCGTLREAEGLAAAGHGDLILAYPFLGTANLRRIVRLCAEGTVTVSVDSVENADLYATEFALAGLRVPCCIIVDTGIGRLGALPSDALSLAQHILEDLPSLNLQMIAAHPGHVYGADAARVAPIGRADAGTLSSLAAWLAEVGVEVRRASGSTPTLPQALEAGLDIVRPGNYVFCDAIQVALGSASWDDCALRARATVLSRHGSRYVLDIGAKQLGLDKGAHASSLVPGFGHILGHDAAIESLSEQVARVRCETGTLRVGDTVDIIPNHACAAANNTDAYAVVRGEDIVDFWDVDLRDRLIR